MPVLTRSRAGIVAPAAACAAGVVAAVVAAGSPAAAAAVTTHSAMGGQAFGSTVRLGSLARSGKTAYVPLCTTKQGTSRKDHTAGLSLPGVGKIGAVTTSMTTAPRGAAPRTTAMTHTAATNLFAGAIHANAIGTKAQAARSGSTTKLTGGSTFVGLRIAGHAVPNPVPNRTFTLPGIGSVVVNQQTRSRKFGDAKITITALHVTIGAHNTSGLPAGQLIIGRSIAALHRPTHRQVTGVAYGSEVRVGKVVKSGRTAPVYLPCGGSNGATLTRNATAGVLLPSVLRTGEVASHARSFDTARRTGATLRSHIARISLFGGALRLRAINARATAVRRSDGTLVRSSQDTSVGNLLVNGTNHPLSNKPNTKYRLPGFGTLWLHRVIRTKNGLRVYAAQLVLGRTINGLQKGAVITLGAAQAGVPAS